MDKHSRNAKGNGSVRQREDGTWEARCVIAGKRRSFYGKKQSDVLKAMRAAQKAADDGTYLEPVKLTVGKWLMVWPEEYCRPGAKPMTYSTYKSRIETHIIPALGKIRLTALNAMQIQSFYNSLQREKNLSPKTIKNVHGILHKALEVALQLRYVGFNAADACTLPRMEKKEIHPLTETEISAFLAEISKGEPLADLFTVALFSGMREGEICGLSWDSVDFESGTIIVRQQLCKEKEKGGTFYIATTKNDRQRILTVPPFVLEILSKVKRRQSSERFAAGLTWVNEWNLVFTDPLGNHLFPQTVLKRFKAVAKRIGRPDAWFHDLRHTYAVTALQEGDDVKTVQENLGHATASFTLDVYGHVSEKMKKESADRMEQYFKKIVN